MLSFLIGIQIFFLIFARMAALLSTATFWGSNLIVFRIRLMVAFFASILMFPMVRELYVASFPISWPIFWFWLINNLLIGLAFGFLISMFFSIFQIAGQFFSFQMGFSISQVLDPISQTQIPVIGQMMALLALLVFLSVNGPMLTIELLYESFKKLSLIDSSSMLGSMLSHAIDYFGFMFAAALQFAITVMGSILIATLFIGLLAKASPQINAMLFGFPLYIGLGFLLLRFLSGNITVYAGNYINNIFIKIMAIFK